MFSSLDPELVDTLSSIFSNVVTGIAAIVVATLAIIGLKTWRKELIGRNQYDSVRRLLLLARRFKASFARSRGPVTWSSEYEARPRNDTESPEEAHIYNEQFARLQRLQPAADLLPDLEQAVYETEIVTGEDLVDLTQPFGQSVRELNIAILRHFESQLMAIRRPDKRYLENIQQKLDQTELIYQHGEDELTKKIDEAVESLETQLSKYMR